MPDDLEEKLIEDLKSGKDVSLERALLIVSGCKTEEEIAVYVEKLDQIQDDIHRFLRHVNHPERDEDDFKAKFIFDYLWEKKTKRFNDNLFLTDVIDAQVSENKNEKIGNCVGLTSLYTVLGLREGFDLSILVNRDHILNRLRTEKGVYDIENTNIVGFGLKKKGSREEPIENIVSHVLFSRGCRKFDSKYYVEALDDYTKAIELNPGHAQAYINRGNIKAELEDHKGAVDDYDKAIELDPNYFKPYHQRGVSRFYIKDFKGAKQDFRKSIRLNPICWQSYVALVNVNFYLGVVKAVDGLVKLRGDIKDK